MLKVGDVILVFNIVLFMVAMTVLGVEPALYSILTYVSAARTLEFILHGIEEYTAMTIMSAAPEPIRAAIVDEMGRGVTVYRASGGKTGEDREILYCVVTRLEIGRGHADHRVVRSVRVRRPASARRRPRRRRPSPRACTETFNRPMRRLNEWIARRRLHFWRPDSRAERQVRRRSFPCTCAVHVRPAGV